MNRTLSDSDLQRLTLLLEFIRITKDGMTKPYDPTPILSKIDQHERSINRNLNQSKQIDLSDLKNCCPDTAVIQDAKDFKPYIMAAVEQFSEIMNLNVIK